MTGPATVLVLGAARVQELRDGDQVLRTPLPLSRRIAVAAVAGGSGTSAVAASVAGLLGRRRGGAVLAVDAGGGSRGLDWQLGLAGVDPGPARDQTDLVAERRRRARTAAEARAGLPTTGTGTSVLTLGPGPDGPRRPADPKDWARDAGPIARFFDVVVTDWGVRPAAADLAEVAASSHVLALVSRADRGAATAAAAVVAALREQADAPRLVLLLVDVGRTPDRTGARLAADLDLPVCWISYDAARAAAEPQGSRALRARTRRDQLRLGVALMRAAGPDPAAGSGDPSRARPTPTARPDLPRTAHRLRPRAAEPGVARHSWGATS